MATEHTLVETYGIHAKRRFTSLMLNNIFLKDTARITNLIDKMKEKNCITLGISTNSGFIYKGESYSPCAKNTTVELHPSHHAEMSLLLGQSTDLSEAKRYTLFYLQKYFSICQTISDMVYLMPKKLNTLLKPIRIDDNLPFVSTITPEQKIKFIQSTESYVAKIEVYLLARALFKL
jgi:hypothetical protein